MCCLVACGNFRLFFFVLEGKSVWDVVCGVVVPEAAPARATMWQVGINSADDVCPSNSREYGEGLESVSRLAHIGVD